MTIYNVVVSIISMNKKYKGMIPNAGIIMLQPYKDSAWTQGKIIIVIYKCNY